MFRFNNRLVSLFLSGTFILAGTAGVRAAQDIFLKFPNIQGDSVARFHEGEIEILGFSANASRADFDSGAPAWAAPSAARSRSPS